MKNIVTCATGFILTIFLAASVMAENPGQGCCAQKNKDQIGCAKKGLGKGPRGRGMYKQLNLNEEQLNSLKTLRQEQHPLRKKTREEMAALHAKIKEELLQDNPDRSLIAEYNAQIAELHRQKGEEMIEHLLKVKEILTPEQFAIIANHHGMKGFHNKRGRGGKGGKGHPGKNCDQPCPDPCPGHILPD